MITDLSGPGGTQAQAGTVMVSRFSSQVQVRGHGLTVAAL